MTLGFGELEGGGVAVHPRHRKFAGWPGFGRDCPNFAIPDARFRANIRDPTQRTGS